MSTSTEAMGLGDCGVCGLILKISQTFQARPVQHSQRRPARQRARAGSFFKGRLACSWTWNAGGSRPGGGVKQAGRLLSTGVAHAAGVSHSESELLTPASSKKKLLLEPFSDPWHVVGVTNPGVVGKAAFISFPGIPEGARRLT